MLRAVHYFLALCVVNIPPPVDTDATAPAVNTVAGIDDRVLYL